jgi:outer membrane receptor protein involved in Fe transport
MKGIFTILRFIVIVVFLNTVSGTVFSVFGQSYEKLIKGKVLDAEGKPVAYATVALKNTTVGTVTDDKGFFSIITNDDKTVQVIIRCIGYEEYLTTIPFNLPKNSVSTFILTSSTTAIDEVVVAERSETSRIKELPFAITAIDAKPLQVKNLDVNQILNTTAGIRIREEGGLGSNFNFSLNGFTGNQVKFFLDGVPMDNFGSSLTLNNIPVNLISSIEIYKGVVPVHLGSDALGGAVNVITNTKIKNFVDASYSYGSFNTHRAAVISRYTNEKTGITVDANVFYNYSDNNYEMTLSVASIENGGKYGAPEKIRRFHDAYESQTAQIKIGLMDKKFADRLFLGVIASENYKELQTGHNMNIVIGEAYDEDKVLIPTLEFTKSNLMVQGLTVNVFANYSIRQALSADTSSRKYDWYQKHETKGVTTTSGEIAWNKTLFSYKDNSAHVTTNVSYKINPIHYFSLNNSFSHFSRVGEDPISLTVVPFSKPNTLRKNITGFSYNVNVLNDRLKTVAFAKIFLMESTGFEGDRYSKTDSTLNQISALHDKKAYGVASTFYLTKSTQLKASYENTYRLPEAKEMFGNGLALLSNLTIKPEDSKNFNVGMLSNNTFSKHRVLAELEFLYRLPNNMIRYVAEGNDGYYSNQVSVKGYSVEGGIKYNYMSKINIEVNGTYQKMVHNNETTPSGGINYLYKQQLANIPFLYGNATLGYQFNDFLRVGNCLSVNWSTIFVEAFYLKSPANGSPAGKNDIPRQISNSADLSYSLEQGRYNISVSCINLTNNELYDNWKLPKPGRAFNVKLRYYFSK